MKSETSSSTNTLKERPLWLFSPNGPFVESLDWIEKEGMIGLSIWQEIRGVYMDPISRDIFGCEIKDESVDKYLLETGKTFIEKMKKGDYVIVLIPAKYEFLIDKNGKKKDNIEEDEYLLIGTIRSDTKMLDYNEKKLKKSKSYREKLKARRYQRKVSWKNKIYVKNLKRVSPLRDVVSVLKSMKNPGILRMDSYLDVLMEQVV